MDAQKGSVHDGRGRPLQRCGTSSGQDSPGLTAAPAAAAVVPAAVLRLSSATLPEVLLLAGAEDAAPFLRGWSSSWSSSCSPSWSSADGQDARMQAARGLKLNGCVWAAVRRGRGQQGPLRGRAWDLWISRFARVAPCRAAETDASLDPGFPMGAGTHRRPEAGAAAWRRWCRRPPAACRRRPALLPAGVADRLLLLPVPLYTAAGRPGRPWLWSERSAACLCPPASALVAGCAMVW